MNRTDTHLLLEVTPGTYGAGGEYTAEGQRLQDLMRSEDVVELVTLPWAPSLHRDASYTDIIVVWDHGEGPHNPTAFDDGVDWRKRYCVPRAVWEYVAEVVEAHNREDDYLWVWLRSDEVDLSIGVSTEGVK